jgi:hypothetical protein
MLSPFWAIYFLEPRLFDAFILEKFSKKALAFSIALSLSILSFLALAWL